MGKVLKQILALLYYPQLDHRLSSHQSCIVVAFGLYLVLVVWAEQ